MCAVHAVFVVEPSEKLPALHAVHFFPSTLRKNPELHFTHLLSPSDGHDTPDEGSPFTQMHFFSPAHCVSAVAVPADFTTMPSAHFLCALHVSVFVEDEDSLLLKCPDAHFSHTGSADAVPVFFV